MGESGLSPTTRLLADLLVACHVRVDPPVSRSRLADRAERAPWAPRLEPLGFDPVRPLRSLDVSRVSPSLVEAAVAHGIAPLLYRLLTRAGAMGEAQPEVRAQLSRLAREAALVESMQRRDLDEVLGALVGEGLSPIVLKGAMLAETHYGEPWLRPRGDTDLLVPPAALPAATALLEGRGYRRALRPDGQIVTHQATYVRQVSAIPVVYDLHWRVADPEAFADVLTYDELFAEARVGLTPGARYPCDVHALILACAHRAAHHYDSDRLLFLYDIDRLARGLETSEWQRFAQLAAVKGIRTVCRRALSLATTLFATPVPDTVVVALANPPAYEPTALYVRPALRRVDLLRSDLGHLPSWRARASLIREHLFPPRDYLLRTYDYPWPILAPLLYLDRIVGGAWRWFRPLVRPPSRER